MGQMTVGLMYGAPLPEGVRGYDDDAEDGGFLARYTKHAVRSKGAGDFWARRARVVPSESEECRVVGFWVALDRGGDQYGVGDIASAPLDEIGNTYGDAISAAMERWETFAAWAATQDVAMSEPRLWLAVTEAA